MRIRAKGKITTTRTDEDILQHIRRLRFVVFLCTKRWTVRDGAIDN